MAQPFAVHASGLGKRYRIGSRPHTGTLYERASDMIGMGPKGSDSNGDGVTWALRDISLDVIPGEVLGIVGRNGSGKTTLLKILARITVPTEGFAMTYGRVAALLSVGTGFHPDLSGRDNIRLSGQILGMTKAEIAAAEEPIVDFAEIGRFLDTPVKHYSSGMYLRLAFSVSVHLAAEIMLIDEILAVGDGAFQLKCRQRIRDAVASGRTVLLVSHAMSTVEELCDRAIVLDAGRMRFIGGADDAVRFYTHDILGISP